MMLLKFVAVFELSFVGGSGLRADFFRLPGTLSICLCGDRRKRRLAKSVPEFVAELVMIEHATSIGTTAARNAFFEDTHLSPILRPGIRPFFKEMIGLTR